MTGAVDPGNGREAPTRLVVRGGDSLRAPVDERVGRLGAGDPGPQSARGGVFPQIVERVAVVAAIEPEVAGGIDPGNRGAATGGLVRRSGDTLRTIVARDAACVELVGAIHPRPQARGNGILPQIVQVAVTLHTRAADVAGAAEEPEVAGGVGPGNRLPARHRYVADRGGALRAVGTGSVDGVGAAHPGPQAGARRELPQVIQQTAIPGAVVALAPEQPEVAARVGPTRGELPRAGDITGGGRALGTVDTVGITHIRAAHPRPFTRARGILPQVVQRAIGGQVETTEQPQVAGRIDPGRRLTPRAGYVAAGGDTLRTEIAGGVTGRRTAHPGPFAGAGGILP